MLSLATQVLRVAQVIERARVSVRVRMRVSVSVRVRPCPLCVCRCCARLWCGVVCPVWVRVARYMWVALCG